MGSSSLALAAVLAAGLVLSGCAKHGNTAANPGATVSGPITDEGSTGLRSKAGAVSAMGDPKAGATIFANNCATCHGAGGAGGGIGPRLKGEKSRKNYQQAVTWIENPKAPMPKLYPAPLTLGDVHDVAAYVETL